MFEIIISTMKVKIVNQDLGCPRGSCILGLFLHSLITKYLLPSGRKKSRVRLRENLAINAGVVLSLTRVRFPETQAQCQVHAPQSMGDTPHAPIPQPPAKGRGCARLALCFGPKDLPCHSHLCLSNIKFQLVLSYMILQAEKT